MEIIFVAGIHDVGKTYYCNSLNDGIKNYSASDLINNYKKIKGKIVIDVEENQNHLLNALLELNDKKIYLDGHFCLLGEENKIKKIPLNVFKETNITKIILLYSEPISICERLKKRDNKDYSVELIEQFQNKEVEYGQEVANELNIPLVKIKV